MGRAEGSSVPDVYLWWRVLAGAILTLATTALLVDLLRNGLRW